jgi:hypothetical protein
MLTIFQIPLSVQRGDGMTVILMRLALMVSGEPWFASKDSNEEHDPTGENWMLDTGNDFFLNKHGETEFRLTGRHGSVDDNAALTRTAVWLLGLKDYQPE